MGQCRVDISKFVVGEVVKIFVRNEGIYEVEMIGRDHCPPRHPIWRVVSGSEKGRVIPCGDVIYL